MANDPEAIKKITKIQSYFRGMEMRDQIKLKSKSKKRNNKINEKSNKNENLNKKIKLLKIFNIKKYHF